MSTEVLPGVAFTPRLRILVSDQGAGSTTRVQPTVEAVVANNSKSWHHRFGPAAEEDHETKDAGTGVAGPSLVLAWY